MLQPNTSALGECGHMLKVKDKVTSSQSVCTKAQTSVHETDRRFFLNNVKSNFEGYITDSIPTARRTGGKTTGR